MKGIEFKNLLKMNDITHENAAIMLHVARNTVSRWCKMEVLPNEIELKINDILKNHGYKTFKQMSDLMVCESTPTYHKRIECQMCKEKDQRIADLKEMNAGYKLIIESQQSVIHSLQLHIDDLQQHHFDVDESTPSRTG
jgi:plasmid maintenance system antidote protein VapI